MGKIKKKKSAASLNTTTENVRSTISKKVEKSTALERNEGKITFEKGGINKIHKKKKEKLKQKHKNLIKKIDLIKEQKKDLIQKKKLEKSSFLKPKKQVITGDLKPLKDALPSLDDLFRLKPADIRIGIAEHEQKKESQPIRKRDKIKKRKAEFLNRYQCFESLLKDPEYKKNPREAIAFHIRYTRGLEK